PPSLSLHDALPILPIDRGILTAAWGVAFIAIVAMPASRGKTDSVVKKVGNSLYRGAYWVLQIAVVMVALLLAAQWIGVLYPDVYPDNPIERFNWRSDERREGRGRRVQ